MANKMHMSQANYSKIEKNEVELTLGRLNDLAAAMSINFWDLLVTDDNVVLNNKENTTTDGGGHIGNYIVQSMSSSDRQIIQDLINLSKQQMTITESRLTSMEKQLEFTREITLKK